MNRPELTTQTRPGRVDAQFTRCQTPLEVPFRFVW